MDDENTGVNERWANPEAPRERAYAAEEQPPTRRTEAIRSDIEQTRAELSETIDAIQDRLRPANLASQAKDTVRKATVGKVKQMADNARSSLRSRGYASDDPSGNQSDSVMDRIRANPIPAALAVASVAWIAFKGNDRSRRRTSPAIYGSTRDGEAFVRETVISEDVDEGWDVEASPDASRSMTAAASTRLRGATARVRNATTGTRDGLQRVTNDNPLAAGAIAAVIGVTIGLALPETERENELMGEARDTVVNRARDAARGAAERVQDAARRVQDVAGDAARSVTSDDEA
jgi:hypothetical protein